MHMHETQECCGTCSFFYAAQCSCVCCSLCALLECTTARSLLHARYALHVVLLAWFCPAEAGSALFCAPLHVQAPPGRPASVVQLVVNLLDAACFCHSCSDSDPHTRGPSQKPETCSRRCCSPWKCRILSPDWFLKGFTSFLLTNAQQKQEQTGTTSCCMHPCHKSCHGTWKHPWCCNLSWCDEQTSFACHDLQQHVIANSHA